MTAIPDNEQPAALRAALAYAARGLPAFPLTAGEKMPAIPNPHPPGSDERRTCKGECGLDGHGLYDATTDSDKLAEWFGTGRYTNLGIAIPDTVAIIDVDPRNGGADTLNEWCDQHGTTWMDGVPSAYTGGDGTHLVFARPDGQLKKNPGRGIDLLWTGKYIVAPPSHTLAEYVWQHRMPADLADLPAMPGWLIDLSVTRHEDLELATIKWTPPPGDRASTTDDLADAAHRHTTWPRLLTGHGWTLVSGDGTSDGSRWRRSGSTNKFSATMRYDYLFNYSSATPLPVTETGNSNGVSLYSAIAYLDYGGDMKAVAARLRADGHIRDQIDWDLPTVIRHAAQTAEAAHTTTPAASPTPAAPAPQAPSPAPQAPPPAEGPAVDGPATGASLPPVLPEAFWTARPALRHIRQAAHHLQVGADGVLAATLMRVASLIPANVVLPDVVARYGSLNQAAIVVGPSGIGKGSALDAGRRLVPYRSRTDLPPIFDGDDPPPSVHDVRHRDLPIGSGEGMVKAFFEQVQQDEDGGKKTWVWQQQYDAILFRVDEGDILKNLAVRSGQTTISMFRQAWSGESIGGTYADRDRRGIVLTEHGYRAAFIIGIQPENAQFLFEDATGGTPQRFLWFTLIDPTCPDPDDRPEWPGELRWTPPEWTQGVPVKVGDTDCRYLPVDRLITTEISERRAKKVRDEIDHDPLDAHADLVQLKISGLFAILDGRLTITVADWLLAAEYLTTSGAVRGWVQRKIRDAEELAEQERIGKVQRSAAAAEAHRRTVSTRVEKIAKRVVMKIASSDGMTTSALRKFLASKEREFLGAAIDLAEREHVIERGDDGRWRIVLPPEDVADGE